MKKLIIALMATSVLFGCARDKKSLTEAQVKDSITKSIPGLPADVKVLKSPIENVFEVDVGRKVFYVTGDAKYLIFGNVIDAASKENLTDKRTQSLSKVDVSQLPLDLAIKVVNGTGERKLIVFSDPECPYCHMFEQQTVPNLKDTTIYTFLFPLPIHPTAKDDSKKIWCSKDKAATWTAWMTKKIPLPTDMKCDTTGLDKIYKIGTDIVQVDGTPTLILSDGQLLSGALPADQLLSVMDQAIGKKSAEIAPLGSSSAPAVASSAK